MSLLKNGQYKAVPSDWGFNKSPEKGTESIFVTFIVDGKDQNDQPSDVLVTWFGYLTPDTKDRTIESIYKLGFNGDLEALAKGHDGKALDVTNVVMVTTEVDTYKDSTKNKIKWINAIGENHGIKKLDIGEAMSIVNKYKGDFLAKKPVGAKKALDLS